MSLVKRSFLEYSNETSNESQCRNKRPRRETDVSPVEILSTLSSEMFAEVTSYLTTFDRIMLAFTNKTFLGIMDICPVRVKFNHSRIGSIPYKELSKKRNSLKKHIWIHAANSGYLYNEEGNIFKWLSSYWPFLSVDYPQFENSWNTTQMLILEAVAGKGSINMMKILLDSRGHALDICNIETRIIAKAARHGNIPMFNHLVTGYYFIKDFSIIRSAIKSGDVAVAKYVLNYRYKGRNICFKHEEVGRVYPDDHTIDGIFSTAAKLGSIPMMDMLLVNGANPRELGFYAQLSQVVESGNLAAVIWYVENQYSYDVPAQAQNDLYEPNLYEPKDLFLAAIRSSNVKILEYIIEHYQRHLKDSLEFLLGRQLSFRIEILEEALRYRNPAMMNLLAANGYMEHMISEK